MAYFSKYFLDQKWPEIVQKRNEELLEKMKIIETGNSQRLDGLELSISLNTKNHIPHVKIECYDVEHSKEALVDITNQIKEALNQTGFSALNEYPRFGATFIDYNTTVAA